MTHLAYIMSAYGVVFVVISALVLWVVFDRRSQLKALERLDARRLPRQAKLKGQDGQ